MGYFSALRRAFSQKEAKLLVFEQHGANPSTSLYHPDHLQVVSTKQLTGGAGVVVEAKLHRKFLRHLRLKLFGKPVLEINSVWVTRLGDQCPHEERASVIEWMLNTERHNVQAAIISVVSATPSNTMDRFVLDCFDAIRTAIPGVAIAILVEESVLRSSDSESLFDAKNAFARRIVASNSSGATDENAFDINTFDTVPNNQLTNTFGMLYRSLNSNRPRPPAGARHQHSWVDVWAIA